MRALQSDRASGRLFGVRVRRAESVVECEAALARLGRLEPALGFDRHEAFVSSERADEIVGRHLGTGAQAHEALGRPVLHDLATEVRQLLAEDGARRQHRHDETMRSQSLLQGGSRGGAVRTRRHGVR